MIKCRKFTEEQYTDKIYGRCVRSPITVFNNWDQSDVESIVHIDSCSNEHGEVKTIVVFYEEKKHDKERN